MERPLSVYVFLSVLISAYTLFRASSDMGSPAGCSSNYLMAMMFFAAVNVLFAIYFQYQVWAQITSDENKDQFEDGDAPTGGGPGALAGAAGRLSATMGRKQEPSAPVGRLPGKWIVPKEVVVGSFKHVFSYDLGVLAMFFGLLVVFFISFKGPAFLDGEGKDKCKVHDHTVWCSEALFWIPALWAFAYMCCPCCADKVTIAKSETEHPPTTDYTNVATRP
jgi:hypothetical protein